MHRRCCALLFLSRVIVTGAGLGHTFFWTFVAWCFFLVFGGFFFHGQQSFAAFGRRRLALGLLLGSDATYYLQ